MAVQKYSGVVLSWPKPNFINCIRMHKEFRNNFHGALTYAHYELSTNDLKKEVQKYLKIHDIKHPQLIDIKEIHENRFAVAGKYFYILNNGGELPDGILEKVTQLLETIVNENKQNAPTISQTDTTSEISDVGKTHGPTIQDRLRDKAQSVAGDVEGWIDDFFTNKKSPVKTTEEFVALFNAAELKAAHIRHLQKCFDSRASEIDAAVAGDKDVLEGYSNLGKVEFKKYITFFKNLYAACNMLDEAAKVERAPRKKKPLSLDKVVSKLKYKKDDKILGLVSQAPTGIIGSKELWTYNTKTRKLTHYKAIDGDTLAVKGASLLNYSSESKEKTLRKPAETLAEFKKASKVKLRTFLKDLSTVDIPASGKLNEHHIILRIDK
jgi:hypothetical protein